MSSSERKPTFAPCGPDGRRPERIDELLAELSTYWHRRPHQRLGQIIDSFAKSLAHAEHVDNPAAAVREIEDDALIGMLRTEMPNTSLAARHYLGVR